MLQIINKLSIVQNYFSGQVIIFTLHRVHPFESEKLYPNENMKVSPEFLEKMIVELKSNGYEFISLDDLSYILKNRKDVRNKIVITFDDGYSDNYTHAYPILKKHNIPFAVYVTSSFPEKTAYLWWYALEDLIVGNEKTVFVDGNEHKCETLDKKVALFFKIRQKIMSYTPGDYLSKLNTIFNNQVNWNSLCDRLALNWSQVIELSKSDLCTIAGHTKNHLVFNKISKNEIVNEIEEANMLIESKINKKIEHFCYPFGGRPEVGENEFKIVKEMNFKTVTTTRRGPIYPAHRNHMECLPRIMLEENFNMKEIGRIRRQRVVTL